MSRPKSYRRDFFVDHVKIDPESPSGLSWSRYNGRQITGMGKDGYYRFQLGGKDWKAHRVVWCLANGDVDQDMIIDHIDRNKQNNNIENLQIKTYSGNRLNRVSGSAKYARKRGVRWEGHFTLPGTKSYIHVGTYDTESKAKNMALARRLELYWVI